MAHDFNVGYSPERINPGDKEHRLETIVEGVAGDSPQTLERSPSSTVPSDRRVYRASSIKVRRSGPRSSRTPSETLKYRVSQ